jgi:hypothetical protein
VDDEKISYPMLERARKLGVKRVCVHKGLPLGPVADHNHPRDIIKAAKDFPEIPSRQGHMKGHMTLYSTGRLREVRGIPTPEGWPSG